MDVHTECTYCGHKQIYKRLTAAAIEALTCTKCHDYSLKVKVLEPSSKIDYYAPYAHKTIDTYVGAPPFKDPLEDHDWEHLKDLTHYLIKAGKL